MGHCDDQEFPFANDNDDHVGETLQQKPSYIVRSGVALQTMELLSRTADCLKSVLQLGEKIVAESRPLLIVLQGRRDCFTIGFR